MLEVEASGVRHRYRRLQSPDDPGALADQLHRYILKRENAEIDRLQQVIKLVALDNCQTNSLAAHFGEQREQPCEHCSWCQRGKSEIPPRHAAAISEEILKKGYELQQEQAEVLTSPRLLTRFLCGVTSPRLSRGKLNAHALFGSLGKTHFTEVLARTEQEQTLWRPQGDPTLSPGYERPRKHS